MIQQNIKKLVAYGLLTGLIEKEDEIYATNRLLEFSGWMNWRTATMSP